MLNCLRERERERGEEREGRESGREEGRGKGREKEFAEIHFYIKHTINAISCHDIARRINISELSQLSIHRFST